MRIYDNGAYRNATTAEIQAIEANPLIEEDLAEKAARLQAELDEIRDRLNAENETEE